MKKVLICLLVAVFFASCSNLTDNQQQANKQSVTKPMENTGGSDGGSTGPAPKDPNDGE